MSQLRTGLLLLASAAALLGQATTGAIVGNVTDPASAAVPQAKIVAVEERTNIATGTVADSEGAFAFPALRPGVYRLEAEAAGFRKLVRSGISLNVVYDTRDNLVNPYSGIFANANFRYNLTMLGSDQNSSSLWLEFRSYIGLSKQRPRHLVAFWVFGNFVTGGTVPYLDLFSLGDDQRARSGRGYLQGRYRGAEFVYGQAEYRFPISPCSQILGGVVFVNACSASNQFPGVRLFDYVKPAVGAGLRIMVNKHFRTNINIDFAVGLGSDGLYFSGQEAF